MLKAVMENVECCTNRWRTSAERWNYKEDSNEDASRKICGNREKDAFDRLISELNTAEERSSELEGKQNLHKLKHKDKKEWRKKITGHQSYETIANNL